MPRTPEHREPRTERHEHYIHPEKSRLDRALEVGVFFLLLGTLTATSIAAYWTSWQWSAANSQLGIMQDTERRQLRAYIGVVPRGIDDFGEPTQNLKIMRKNYGATPAYDLFMDKPNIAVVEPQFQFAPAVCWPAPPAPVNTLTLFPNQELRYNIRVQPLSKEQIQLVRSGTQYELMYWGTLHYKDTFGDTRCTRYCWTFKGASMTENDSEYWQLCT